MSLWVSTPTTIRSSAPRTDARLDIAAPSLGTVTRASVGHGQHWDGASKPGSYQVTAPRRADAEPPPRATGRKQGTRPAETRVNPQRRRPTSSQRKRPSTGRQSTAG